MLIVTHIYNFYIDSAFNSIKSCLLFHMFPTELASDHFAHDLIFKTMLKKEPSGRINWMDVLKKVFLGSEKTKKVLNSFNCSISCANLFTEVLFISRKRSCSVCAPFQVSTMLKSVDSESWFWMCLLSMSTALI